MDPLDTVMAVTPYGVPRLVRARCRPGLARTAGTALARRPETSFCYLLTGQAELAELPQLTPQSRQPDGDELTPDELTPDERALVRALREDGRRTHEELARLAGVSESTARRRVESLRRSGAMYIRAVVEPASLAACRSRRCTGSSSIRRGHGSRFRCTPGW
ncbi:Lrp/AsnC family transcriptional regulator [Amycolatopsis speibonae]|uniref:Lrp/AsnC family transcriptional regulator n=1 Tax=Amycolatopsis speibonae TaxID=1450224 RepID=A0ABV7P725_9PSEU